MRLNILTVVLGLVFAVGLYFDRADALPEPLGTIQSFAQTATTTATRVAPTTWVRTPMKSCKIGNPSATPIYLGGSDLTSANGFPVCTDTAVCASAVFPVDVLGGELYVLTSSGTQAFRAICGS